MIHQFQVYRSTFSVSKKLLAKNFHYRLAFESLAESDMPSIRGTSATGFALVLSRRVNQYMINLYLPTALLVVLSFVSFFIPPEIVPGRMALLVTVFLTIVNIGSAAR